MRLCSYCNWICYYIRDKAETDPNGEAWTKSRGPVGPDSHSDDDYDDDDADENECVYKLRNSEELRYLWNKLSGP